MCLIFQDLNPQNTVPVGSVPHSGLQARLYFAHTAASPAPSIQLIADAVRDARLKVEDASTDARPHGRRHTRTHGRTRARLHLRLQNSRVLLSQGLDALHEGRREYTDAVLQPI